MAITNQKYAQTQTFQLAGAGVSEGNSTMDLTSFNQINGVALTMSNFGIVGYGTVEPGSGVNEEQIQFTGITNNVDGTVTLTGVSTVLNVYPYTATANFAQGHAGGTSFVISNTAGFYSNFANVGNDESIIAKWTFLTAQRPTLTADTDTVTVTDLVTYGQLARTAIAGAPNATTSLQGLVQLATQAQYDTKTAVGGTGASLVATPALNRATKYNDYVADTGSVNAYVITPSPAISAYANGQQFTFVITNTNTSTIPTLAVSGLSAITIQKQYNSALGSLNPGDLVAGNIAQVVYYNGTFQLVSSIASLGGFKSGVASPSSGTTTITHGLGYTPTIIRLIGYGNNGGSASSVQASQSTGSYSRGSQSMAAMPGALSGAAQLPTTSTSVAIYIDIMAAGAGSKNNATGVVGNLTATTFDIVWTGNPNTGVLYWEAQ